MDAVVMSEEELLEGVLVTRTCRFTQRAVLKQTRFRLAFDDQRLTAGGALATCS